MTDERKLAKYLLIIKKQVKLKVSKSPDQYDLLDDIVQEVFIKLYNGDFFNKFPLNDDEQTAKATAYIKRTVNTCHIDTLTKAGLLRKLTDKEQSNSDCKYENMDVHDWSDSDESVTGDFSNEGEYLDAKKFYQILKSCFDSAISAVSNPIRANFLNQAFWEQASYNLPLKSLAEILGYASSNPTQDFNRFTHKVNDCTEPSGMKINNPAEQIEFLQQIILDDGGLA